MTRSFASISSSTTSESIDDTGCDSDDGSIPVIVPDLERRERLDLLSGLLKQDSTKLINLLCSEMAKWQEVGSHKPNTETMQKIRSLSEDFPALKGFVTGNFYLQTIENAGGSVINMDNFSVNVTSLPQGYSAETLLTHIRRNINGFIDTDLSSFYPYDLYDNYPYDESNLWGSANPLGSILHIEIPPPAGDGSVICSDYASDHWTFSTIAAPWDRDHPVSGSREFGFEQNADGSYTFYTRGVDRITSLIGSWVGNNIFGNPFEKPDQLWTSFQNGIEAFVNMNGGTATKEEPVIGRPDWDKVEGFINGTVSIDEIGCKQ